MGGVPRTESLMPGGLTAAVAMAAVASLLVYRRLRARRTETQYRLGSPGLVLRIPTEARRSLSRFIRGGEFPALGDRTIPSSGRGARRSWPWVSSRCASSRCCSTCPADGFEAA